MQMYLSLMWVQGPAIKLDLATCPGPAIDIILLSSGISLTQQSPTSIRPIFTLEFDALCSQVNSVLPDVVQLPLGLPRCF